MDNNPKPGSVKRKRKDTQWYEDHLKHRSEGCKHTHWIEDIPFDLTFDDGSVVTDLASYRHWCGQIIIVI